MGLAVCKVGLTVCHVGLTVCKVGLTVCHVGLAVRQVGLAVCHVVWLSARWDYPACSPAGSLRESWGFLARLQAYSLKMGYYMGIHVYWNYPVEASELMTSSLVSMVSSIG